MTGSLATKGTLEHLKINAMALQKFKFYITECTNGVLEVKAENYEEALEKAYGMDGDFFGYDTEMINVELID